MDVTNLKKLGLSDKEVKVYISLLEYGAISVRSLAELAGLNRGTTYDILKRLQEVGLVSYYHQHTKQKFIAEDPEKLLGLIESKEKEIKNVKSGINNLIPELKSLQDKGGSGPVTKYFEGARGVKYILDDVLLSFEKQEEKEYFIYSAANVSDDINDAYPDFTKTRIKKKIKVKAISLSKGGKVNGLDERKWLGTNNESATFILLYSGKCAYISRDVKGSPVGVIIENENIYQTQKTIFLEIWKNLK